MCCIYSIHIFLVFLVHAASVTKTVSMRARPNSISALKENIIWISSTLDDVITNA